MHLALAPVDSTRFLCYHIARGYPPRQLHIRVQHFIPLNDVRQKLHPPFPQPRSVLPYKRGIYRTRLSRELNSCARTEIFGVEEVLYLVRTFTRICNQVDH